VKGSGWSEAVVATHNGTCFSVVPIVGITIRLAPSSLTN
jgi:hypothetical protein